MRRLLVLLGVAWIASNLLGAWMSVRHDLPYDLSFVHPPGTEARIGDDWLHGWGTGLAMPFGVLAATAVLIVLVSFGGGVGRLAAALMMLVGAAALTFTLTNQPTYDRLRAATADRPETALVLASLTLSALLVLVGFLTVLTTPRTRRR